MKKIGGLLPMQETLPEQTHCIDTQCPHEDLRFMLSGRCAIYYALQDLLLTDTKRVAYLPLYTCETVAAPYQKAGYRLMFYPLDRNMCPQFDESVLDQISVLNLCGYFGFCSYDRGFVKQCARRGITILEDTTHSILSSNGIDPMADYVVGSMRKWMGIAAGGFAIKRRGRFVPPLLLPHEEHLRLRYEAIEKNSTELFWQAEQQLRQIFDCYAGDDRSTYILQHADYELIRKKRRENYQYLLDHTRCSDAFRIVFPTLDECAVPSHFTLLVNDRPDFREYMEKNEVKTSIFWPKGPLIEHCHHEDTQYLYEHVISLPCDQRFDCADMQLLCDRLNGYKG